MLGIRKSFRLRIMLLSVLLSGVVLLAFGVATRYALYQLKLRSIDQTLRVAPVPDFPHPKEERIWMRVAEMIDQYSGEVFGGEVSIAVYGVDGVAYFKSVNWPESVELSRLTPAEGELDERAPRFGRESDFEDLRRRFQRGGDRRGSGPRGPRGFRDPESVVIETIAKTNRIGVYRHHGYNIALAVDLTRVASDLGNLRYAFFWALPVALILLATGSWFIATRAIKPVRTLAATAREISAERLSERIVKTNEDAEFSDLIDVFNQMLERLEGSFVQATRFSADAAHELKTPLAILQGHIEAALQKEEDGSAMQQELGVLLEETQRLKGITSKLLILSRADAGTLAAKMEPIMAKALLEEIVEDFEMQSPEASFHMTVQDETVLGDRSFITRIVQNLLSNAVKYNDPENPKIWIRCRTAQDDVFIEVESAGPLVGANAREKLFDRFARADDSRNRSVDGLGLGLSLSREYARAMGGMLEWTESLQGRNCFILTLRFA